MLVSLVSSPQHLSFLRLIFLLVVLFLVVNTVSLPFGVSATSVLDKERYHRTAGNPGFLEGKWKLLTRLQRSGLRSGRGRNAAVRKQSSQFGISWLSTFELTHIYPHDDHTQSVNFNSPLQNHLFVPSPFRSCRLVTRRGTLRAVALLHWSWDWQL